MKRDDFIPTVRNELDEIKPELTVMEEHDAFTIWFVSKYLDCSIPEADDAFVGGSNDFGIDAVFIPSSDNEDEVVGYVVQTKFTDQSINADIVNNLRAKQDWLGKPLPDEMNPRVRAKWEILNRALQTGGEGSKVRFVIASLGSCTEAADASSREEFSLPQVDALDIYDFGLLYDLYYPGFEDNLDEQLVQTEWDLEANQVMEIEGEAVRSWLAVVPLIKLKFAPGIDNKRLFAANVRYEISRTAVKRGIKRTVANQQSRSRFFLHHNGITIVAGKVLPKRDNILSLRSFSVVNR